MRILILGGTAFLSAEIARQAVAAGHDTTCLARGSAAAPPDGSAWIRSDRSWGPEAYAGAGGQWDAVIDVTRDPAHATAALEALAGRSGHWTVVSSCSVYADHSVPGSDEGAALLAALGPASPLTAENYGEAKSAIERVTADIAIGPAREIPVTNCLRAGGVARRPRRRVLGGAGFPAIVAAAGP